MVGHCCTLDWMSVLCIAKDRSEGIVYTSVVLKIVSLYAEVNHIITALLLHEFLNICNFENHLYEKKCKNTSSS